MALRHLFMGKYLEERIKILEENLASERDKRLSDTKLWMDRLDHEREMGERSLTTKEQIWKDLLAKADAKIDDLNSRMLTMAGVPVYGLPVDDPAYKAEVAHESTKAAKPGTRSTEADIEQEEREWRFLYQEWQKGKAALDSE